MDDNILSIKVLTKEQLLARREAILALLGMTHKEFTQKSMHQGLEGTEWDYEAEMDMIDFLLGDDDEQE